MSIPTPATPAVFPRSAKPRGNVQESLPSDCPGGLAGLAWRPPVLRLPLGCPGLRSGCISGEHLAGLQGRNTGWITLAVGAVRLLGKGQFSAKRTLFKALRIAVRQMQGEKHHANYALKAAAKGIDAAAGVQARAALPARRGRGPSAWASFARIDFRYRSA